MIIIKSVEEIKKISAACKIVAEILNEIERFIIPGVTTEDIEKLAEKSIYDKKALPAFKGYRGYPSCLCISINNVVVHGIPSKNQVLKEGDIASIDIGVKLDGFYGDAAKTFPVGKVNETAMRLLNVTKESLYEGIRQAKSGNRVSDISYAVQRYAEDRGYSVVKAFVGHGIGRDLHEDPQIPNFGRPNKGARLKSGMVLAIEPMINEGGFQVKILEDGWTAVTADNSLSAHFEHTIAVTDNNPKILTIID
ncbi:MAG: type I methionyl aminopeptidase [Nitrospirae bacterium]|nr:type I methionyl aminopeptidase [Nitrospirota bacterium]